ncbi:unnamed protein product [Eretmochelys imbricata]
MDHGYLLDALQAFGFESHFVGFLQVPYVSVERLTKLNRLLTKLVIYSSRVCQDCLLSSQLYSIANDPLLRLLYKRMMGLMLQEPDLQMVMLAYADNMLLMAQPRRPPRVVIYLAAPSTWVNCQEPMAMIAGKQASSHPRFDHLMRCGSAALSGHLPGSESTVCPCCQEGQWHFGLYK